ncbi:MAG: AarF/ABC1/UbiB kinase family protein [Planctomycetaceae bacterium]
MPSLTSIPQAVRNAGRLQQVISVLAKYGLATWLHRIPLDWLQKHFRTSQGDAIARLTWPERVREALAELGTTFIKIGQILSTRPDIVGPELADQLSALQSSVPPDDFAAVRALIEKELRKPIEEVFASFEETPIASASIGQVHRARLHDGQQVAVKVQHPGIEEKLRSDLEIAHELATLVETHSTEAALYRPVTTVDEIRRSLLKELDFGQELRNAQIFARHFHDDPRVRFPGMFPEFSTRRVLTMEFLQGIELSRIEAEAGDTIDLQVLAEQGAGVFLEMVFRDGLFHADPHPGNLLLLTDGVIGILDCGMVGRIDELFRDQFEDLLLAAVDGDSEGVVEGIISLGELPEAFDRRLLTHDIVEFFDHYSTLEFSDFDLGTALNDATAIIRRQNIRLPARLSMLIRMLAVLEGTAESLSPSFQLVDLLRPYRARIVRRRLSPARLRRRMLAAYRQWSHLIDIIPGDVADILQNVKQGRFDVHLDHRRLDGIVNRLVRGIIVAALFVGSSLLWSRSVPPHLYGFSIPGVLGSSLAIFLGARLLADLRDSADR